MMESKMQPTRQISVPGDLSAAPKATAIDRRQSKRQVPMRVLVLGLSRTGTTSLRQALIDLGYDDCYHFTTPLQENPLDQKLWISAIEGKFEFGREFSRLEWDQLLGHCQAASDTPCIMFWRELLAAYPEAKVILTVRDSANQWVASITKTILPLYVEMFGRSGTLLGWVLGCLVPIDPVVYRFNELILRHSPMMRCLWDDWRNGTETAKGFYEEWRGEVEAAVPVDRLLVLNVKEGWQPLCRFLGEAQPEKPFPRLNDCATHVRNSEQIRKRIRAAVGRRVLGIAKLGVGVLVGVAAVGMFYY